MSHKPSDEAKRIGQSISTAEPAKKSQPRVMSNDRANVDTKTTVLWTEETAMRLRIYRMHCLKTQKEFAELLGLTQQQLAKVESHRVSVVPQLTTAVVRAVTGKFFPFILFGGAMINGEYAHARYREHQRLARKAGSGEHGTQRGWGDQAPASVERMKDMAEIKRLKDKWRRHGKPVKK